jgi:hypothetical protein
MLNTMAIACEGLDHRRRRVSMNLAAVSGLRSAAGGVLSSRSGDSPAARGLNPRHFGVSR